MELVFWTYLLTFLIPVNGLILIAMIRERKRNKQLLMAIWKFRSRR